MIMFPHFIDYGWVCNDLTYTVPSVKEGLLSRTWAPVGQISFSSVRRNGPPAPRARQVKVICVFSTQNAADPSNHSGWDFMGYWKEKCVCPHVLCLCLLLSHRPPLCHENLRSPQGCDMLYKTSSPSPKTSPGQMAPQDQVCASRHQLCRELLEGAQEDSGRKDSKPWQFPCWQVLISRVATKVGI